MWLWADFSLAVDGRLCWFRLIVDCHWRELPQRSFFFFPRQKFCCDKHVFVATKHIFCSDKNMLVRDKHTLLQKYFVATKLGLSRQKLCPGKHIVVATKDVFCRNKRMFVVKKKLLLWQKWCLWQLPPVIVDWRPLATGSRRCWRSEQRLISFGCRLASFSHGQQTLLA